MADDLGFEAIESYGGVSYETPQLSRLAEEGMQFGNCFSQPLCTPSRVQIMTGLYNVRNYKEWTKLGENEWTFGHFMRDRGYATCIAGKWQLDGDAGIARHFGFEESLLWYVEGRNERYQNVGDLVRNGEIRRGGNGEYGPDVMNEFVLDFIERKQREPFFIYYPMMLPHAPFEPTPDSDPENLDTSDQRYFSDMVTYMDKLIGKVIDQLDRLELRERTLVIFTGDNGTNARIVSLLANGEAIRGGKGETVGDACRVPLIASWPGSIAEGSVSAELVDFTDFFSTLVDLAGDASESSYSLDGVSFLPQLEGIEGAGRQWSYTWYAQHPQRDTPIVFAKTLRYKLYADRRFYDVGKDPRELEPLNVKALDSAERPAMQKLQGVLKKFEGVAR